MFLVRFNRCHSPRDQFFFFLVTCSDLNSSSQQLSELISHSPPSEENEDTTNRAHSWIVIDLGLMILPTHLTLRHATGGLAHWTKSLIFQISRDIIHFLPCDATVLNENSSSTATWSIKNLPENPLGFRYIRMQQKCGRHPINIAGFEIYGQVLSCIDIRSSKNCRSIHSPHILEIHCRIGITSFSSETCLCTFSFNIGDCQSYE